LTALEIGPSLKVVPRSFKFKPPKCCIETCSPFSQGLETEKHDFVVDLEGGAGVRRCVPKVLSVPRNFCQAVYTITLTLVSCFGPPTA
jgi:hypothetical protein